MGSSGNHFCVQWNNHQKNLLTVMSELLQNNALTDVTLGVDDGRSVECHKMILAACSSYFQTLFTQYPCKHPFVVLSGVKYPEIMRIVEFMYKGEVNVAQDELDAILKVAEALQVKGLIEANGWSPDTDVPPSPANNTSNNTVLPSETTKNARHRRKSSSPAHSTSKPYHIHEEASVSRENQAVPPLHTWPLSQGLPLSPQDLAAAEAAYQASLSTKYSSPVESHYEKPPVPRSRKRKMSRENVINRGTPILRTALKQSQAVPSLPGITPTYPEHQDAHYSSHTNGSTSTVNDENDDRQSSVDLSYRHPAHSPYATNTSMINGDDKTFHESFLEDSRAGIANYSSAQANEGKRYKKYSRDDLTDAIQAVKEGMSANKAAVLFKVPSRTLYDKIKKLGFTNTKHRRSGSSNSGGSACFPYGIGGNVDGSIYGHVVKNDNDNDNSNISTENPSNVLEVSYTESPTYAESRDDSMDRNSGVKESDRKPPSPQVCPRSQSPMPLQSQSQQQQRQTPLEDNDNCNENEAEDLSVSRKSDIPVLIPPSIRIKEEIALHQESNC